MLADATEGNLTGRTVRRYCDGAVLKDALTSTGGAMAAGRDAPGKGGNMRWATLILSVVLGFAAILQAEAASVSKQQREAVIFITNLSQGSNLEQQFYDVVEFAAAALGQGSLTPNYQKVTTIQGSGATLTALRNALKTAASKTGIKAVDLVFVTHGLSGEVLFADGRKTMDQVKAAIVNNLTAAQRSKLRISFPPPVSDPRTGPNGAMPASRPHPDRRASMPTRR